MTPGDDGAGTTTAGPPVVVPEWLVRWRRTTQRWGLALPAASLLLATPFPGPGDVL